LRSRHEWILAPVDTVGAAARAVPGLGTPPAERDLGLSEAMYDAVAAAIFGTAPATGDPTAAAVAVTFLTVLSDLPARTDAERTLMAEWAARSLAALR
jgi:hypothetical protein